MGEETYAITPRFVSTAPVSSTMTSSENGYSLSLTTKRALIILSRWRPTSAGLPLIVQHFSAWRLQLQTLVARKVFAALKVPQNLVVIMSQHRHLLATNSPIKMTGFCCNICGPSHKGSPNITRPPCFLHFVRFLGM